MIDSRDRWAVLTLTFGPDRTRIVYRDGLGRRQVFKAVANAWELSLPEELLSLIESLATTLLVEPPLVPSVTKPPSVPMFVRAPQGLLHPRRLRDMLQRSLPTTPPVEIVAFGARPVRRPAFELPFRILVADPDLAEAIRRFEAHSWMNEPGVRENGVQIRPAEGDVLRMLSSSECDILLGGVPPERLRELPLESRPRLAVTTFNVETIPEGVSVLQGDVYPLRDHLEAFLLGLIHDNPLHEAFASIAAGGRFTLWSDPRANHSLRLRDACAGLRRQALSLQARLGITDRDRIARHDLLESLLPTRTDVARMLDTALYRPIGFGRESTSLVPLVSAQADLEQAHALSRMGPTAEPGAVQERRVDIGMDRLETDPFLAPVQDTKLQAGARYQVRVHIGVPLPSSLVAGLAPAIDPLLPAPESAQGHELEIVLQEKDFTLLSRRARKTMLPLAGGSQPVFFIVRAPRAAMEKAAMRVCVYYRNHLVQAFGIEAEIVWGGEIWAEQAGPTARLEFSRTGRFANLDELRPRALSIVANYSPCAGTHNLLVKGETKIGNVNLEGDAFTKAMDQARAVLKNATEKAPGKRNRYPATAPGDAPAASYATVIRQLAELGNDLYQPFFRQLTARSRLAPENRGADPPFRSALKAIRDSSGQKIQVARLRDVVFPWSLLYDYQPADFTTAPVCLGFAKDSAGAVRPCGHTFESEACCIRGFWGVRHQIEELLPDGPDDPGGTIECADHSELVRLIGGDSIPDVDKLQEALGTTLGASEVALGPADDQSILDLLWAKPPQRPAVLAIVAHLETGPPTVPGEPKDDRIVLTSGSKWLTARHISRQFVKADGVPWDRPCRPLVLLMACGSAVDATELNSFFASLYAAGAGGIVGTECVVYSDLACEFARFLTLKLCLPAANGHCATLGEAMTEFRFSQLQCGNPLAFVFRSIGDVDLCIQQ